MSRRESRRGRRGDGGPSRGRGRDDPQRPTRGGVIRDHGKSLGWAVGVALLLRAFVAEAYVVPTGSMTPSLLVGDRLFANKFVYGLKVPFVNYKLVDGRAPRPGEVVIFDHPRDDTTLRARAKITR